MRYKNIILPTALSIVVLIWITTFQISRTTAIEKLPQSTTVLEFADANTLFVADSDGGQIFAYQLPDEAEMSTSRPYNIEGLGSLIAEAFNVNSFDLSYHDVAVHPVTKEAYVSLTVQTANDGPSPAIVRINQDGKVEKLDLSALPNTTMALENTADDSVTFWRDIAASTFTMTDLDFVDGTLFVAGLSTGEFASTLRKIPFPFQDTIKTSSIEIFHTVHNQTETRAPIRAMTIIDLDGVQTVVAAYTCTPLVTIAAAELEDNAHVTGKTVAELGFGNTPLDVISFSTMNQQGQPEDYVLVINKNIDADLIRVVDLLEASKGEGMTEIVALGESAGVLTVPTPLGAVLQADDQDEQFLLTLKRNIDTGDMDLVSFRKGAYMRINDFVSEYNFPDYQYDESQEFARRFQNTLKTDEGFSDLVR